MSLGASGGEMRLFVWPECVWCRRLTAITVLRWCSYRISCLTEKSVQVKIINVIVVVVDVETEMSLQSNVLLCRSSTMLSCFQAGIC